MIERILLTGFEPWGAFTRNSSWMAIERLDGERLGGALVKALLLPVDGENAPRLLAEAARGFGPQAVVSFGMDSSQIASREPGIEAPRTPDVRASTGHWRVELLARNRVGSPEAAEIVPGGPRVLPTGLPAARLHGKLLEAGFEARFSEDAGTFVCNQLFYRSMLEVGQGTLPLLTGFVHVPPPPDADDEKARDLLEGLQDAARLVAEAVVTSVLAR